MTADPLYEPAACTAPLRCLTAQPADGEEQLPPSVRGRWVRIWPSLLAVVTLPAVGGPAAVASYRHARDVIAEHGDVVMAPWLALTTDGMLLAALVVIWVRRHRRERVGVGPWAAFWAGMAATIAANLAAAQPSPVGVVVALWPPVCLAITLELIALVASAPEPHTIVPGARAGERTGHVLERGRPASGCVTDEAVRRDRAARAGEAGNGERVGSGQRVGEVPAEPVAEAAWVSTAVPVGTNGHGHGLVPERVPASPSLRLRDVSDPAVPVPGPASGYGSELEFGQGRGCDARHVRVGAGRVSDGDILAWLREKAGSAGRVPGRRKVIDRWAIGSTRAERLRRIVLDEAARSAAAASAG